MSTLPITTRLILRRRMGHPAPTEKETVEGLGYWVEFHRVRLDAVFFWNGHWYTKGVLWTGHGINGVEQFKNDTPVFVRKTEDLK